MSGSCIRERKAYNFCRGCKRITGTKWERPISSSKEYWEKFCDDEEKRLIVVRDPFLQLSYDSFSKTDLELLHLNLDVDDKALHRNSFSNADDRHASDNSLHKPHPAGSKPKSILKRPFRAVPKIPDTMCNLATSSKVVRIPKLDTLGPQPSFRKVLPGKVDHTRAPFSVQNEPKARGESSSILPTLGTALTTSDPRLTVKKLRKHLRLPDKKDFKIKDQSRYKIDTARDKKPSANGTTIREIKEESQKASRDEDSLRCSARFAYKALKRLTKNKNLDYKPKANERFREDPLLKSRDEKQDLLNVKRIVDYKRSEESSYIFDLEKISEQKSLEDSESVSTDVESAILTSNETTSRSIPTETRYTSGPSPEFVYPEPWVGPSSRILASIPKLSGFPRKNRDRCLPCMYKSFETPPERKISLPKAALQRIIDAESGKVISPKDSFEDSGSASASTSSFESEVKRILNREIETGNVTFDEESNAAESEVVTEAAPRFQEKHERPAEAAKARSVSESESSFKAITKKAKEVRRDDDATSTNLNEGAASVARVTTLEREVSSSLHSESSEEHDSIAVSISDDQPKPKYLVPCHAPTNFRPSLEHLRALRNRKPTTLQDRIAFLESSSLKKSTSVDDSDGIPQKPRPTPKEVLEKDKTGSEGKPVPPPLTKAKSVAEKLTLEKAEASTEKRRQLLRKGISFTGFSVSEDTASDRSEMHRDASKDALRELDATRGDGFLKTPFATDFSRAQTKLPLTRPNEVVETLENLEEDVSSTSMLEILCKEFSERLPNFVENNDSNAKQRAEMITGLTKLLVDSKRYLHSDKYPSNLVFSTNQPPQCNSRLLKHLLPMKSYNLVAPLLGMPECHPKKESVFTFDDAKDAKDRIQVLDYVCKDDSLVVHPPSSRDSESLGDKEKLGHRRYNPYGLFLTKPRREVVTWRPLTKRDLEGYDPDATLEMRADNSMKRICQDFCQWVETLGGTDNTIDEEVLRDMFEIDFSAEACRAMQVSIQEMPVVPAEVALTRNCPGASKLAMTKKHVMKDVKAEERPAKVKAFGTSMPWELRFVPPNNQVRKNWLQCENVPRDIETMEVVWKDILHLRSVRGFVEWLQQHPEIPQPHALKKIASMNIELLRQIEEDETFAHLELDIDQIRSLRVLVNGDVTQ